LNIKKNLPVIGLLVTATLWGTVWYPYRLLEKAGVSGEIATLMTNLVAFAIFISIFPRAWREFKQAPIALGALALSVGYGYLAYILGVLTGNLMRVLLLFYLTPLWIVPLAWFILKEKISKTGYAIVSLALCGAMIILWNPSIGLPLPVSVAEWLGLSAGFSFALANVLVRRAADCSIGVRTLSTSLGTVIAASIAVLLKIEISTPMLGAVYNSGVLILIIGVLVVLMSLSAQYGLSNVPAVQANIILLFELVVAAIASFFLTDETIGPKEWVGGAIILIASLFTDEVKATPDITENTTSPTGTAPAIATYPVKETGD